METVPTPSTQLAPSPDFRYVGLEFGAPRALRAWVGILGAGALVGAFLRGPVGAAVGLGLVGATSALAHAFGGQGSPRRAHGKSMVLAPWGVVVDDGDRARILRWPGVTRVEVHAVHGRDGGTPHTRYTVVTVFVGSERFVGRAAGLVALDRLVAHLPDYAEEASHHIALDLDGIRRGEGPTEPDVELVLSAARAYLATSDAAARLDLPGAGYRKLGHGGSTRAASLLSRILRDRTARTIDPRPFAAAVAAELDARELSDDLVSLVQSPLPLLAALAKVAATKLGAAKAKVGSLEEVEPFLLRADLDALLAWQA